MHCDSRGAEQESTMTDKTIKQDTIALLTRKRPLTYEAIVGEIQKRHPGAQTTVKTVQWYASRLRADGQEVNVKRANSVAPVKNGKAKGGGKPTAA
jgi:hypothetical protein